MELYEIFKMAEKNGCLLEIKSGYTDLIKICITKGNHSATNVFPINQLQIPYVVKDAIESMFIQIDKEIRGE